jgi:hypothetical protein
MNPMTPPPPGTPADLLESLAAEWTARPLGRLGRRLLPEIERYTEFFAIAHGHVAAGA